LFTHQVGNGKPAQAVGNLGGVWFPDSVVFLPDAPHDITLTEVSQGGFYIG